MEYTNKLQLIVNQAMGYIATLAHSINIKSFMAAILVFFSTHVFGPDIPLKLQVACFMLPILDTITGVIKAYMQNKKISDIQSRTLGKLLSKLVGYSIVIYSTTTLASINDLLSFVSVLGITTIIFVEFKSIVENLHEAKIIDLTSVTKAAEKALNKKKK